MTNGTRTAGAGPAVPHLQRRAAALAALGWRGRDAAWLALVCLHSGVFLRSQYLAFTGQSNPALPHRFVKRCGAAAVEEPWNGCGMRVCRIAGRPIYRALGAEDVRHRRAASAPVVLRRLLSLDYVLDDLDAAWLPTEGEKVAALTAAGIGQHALPGRLYHGPDSSQRRHFVHKLPVALDAERATFVFVQAEDETVSALRTWGEQHAALWAALRGAGRAVEVVVAGRDPVRLAAAERVLDRWTQALGAVDAEAERRAEAARAAREEFIAVRASVAAGDLKALEPYGGLNGALARMSDLAEVGEAKTARPKPAVTAGRTWRSRRVPE